MSSFKRARSPQRQDDSPSPSPTPSPTFKAARTSTTPPPGAGEPSTSSHILCTLPPTCNPPNRPTSLEDTRELEAHYAMYHAHVCEDPGCGCVFPDERLLELHQTECHDPLAAVRRERGEKIFACHLASCARRFSAPKTRRLHLIQAHGYPKEYFFAVTNKGVGGLLKRWGEGASLLRRPWQPRENADEDDDEDEDGTATDVTQVQSANGGGVLSDDDEEQILLEKMPVDRPARVNTTAGNGRPTSPAKGKGREAQPSEEDNTLADAMDSLSLVPSSVQFGRGAKRGGRGHVARGGGGGARGAGRGAFANGGGEGAPMQLDFRPPNVRGRGRGAGRGFHVPRGGGFARGRGNGPRGFGRGAMLGGGVVRGAGPGRGVAKGNINA